MAKRKTAKQREKASSLIVSRVQREAMAGKLPTGNTIIRSRVIHGDAAGAVKPKKPATTKRPTRSRARSRARTASPSTET